ncbi:uncharacterized protein [Triticum aestivum]|uniref:uncharacterized protein n=1 Tax=Triticum aestivum TaxID=4565 RepID=UPI001D011633|nr:uncharacterized protein LOC123171093 [Triticum aestivum]
MSARVSSGCSLTHVSSSSPCDALAAASKLHQQSVGSADDGGFSHNTTSIEASVHARAEGERVEDGDAEEEPEVQSRLAVLEEVATHDPEEQILSDGEKFTYTGSCCGSTTNCVRQSSTDINDYANPSKRARLAE